VKPSIVLVVGTFLAVLQASAVPYIQVLGVAPDLILIFAASWAVVRGYDEGFWVIPILGFTRDFISSDPVGTSALALAPIVLLAAVVRLRAMDSEFVPTAIVVAAGTLLYGIISIAILRATGQDTPVTDGALVVLPAIIVNAVFTPIVYFPVHWLGSRTTMRILGPGRISMPL